MGDYVLLLDAADAQHATLSSELAECGVPVRVTRDLDEALCLIEDNPPSVLLIRTENGAAVSWCRSVRRLSNVPVAVVCAEREEQAIVRYLEAGADSVLAGPRSRRELAARIGALVNSTRAPRPATQCTGSYRVADVVVDARAHVVTKAGRKLSLTPTEFRLLVSLARRAGAVATYAELLAEVWGGHDVSSIEQLRLYIGYLRQKLEHDPCRPRILRTHRGVGYSLMDEALAATGEGRTDGHVAARA